jgi:hypothetical protein
VTQMPSRPLARSRPTRQKNEPPITVIIGGRALLMLIAARFSGPASGKTDVPFDGATQSQRSPGSAALAERRQIMPWWPSTGMVP